MFTKLFTLLAILGQISATPKPVIVLMGGDVMPSGSLLEFVEKDPLYPFRNIMKLLHSADVAFFNLECPITDTGTPVEGKEYIFKLPPHFAWALKKAGVTGVALANNHIMDFGVEGLASTIRVLYSLGIGHCGAGMNIDSARKPYMVMARGIKIAFLCYSNTLPKSYWADSSKAGTIHGVERNIKYDLRRTNADFKVVVFHWSSELLDTPKLYQKILARYAIDHGASVVIGHHPHVVQPIEFYKGKPIFYSLGNFIFGSYTKKANGMLAMAKIFSKDSADFYVIPLKTTYWTSKFQTTPSDSLDYIKRLCPGVNFIAEKFAGYVAFRVEPGDTTSK